jgi:hypothetical protein
MNLLVLLFLLIPFIIFDKLSTKHVNKPSDSKRQYEEAAAFWYGTSFEATQTNRNNYSGNNSFDSSDSEYDNVNW